jgi:hypothetical protein
VLKAAINPSVNNITQNLFIFSSSKELFFHKDQPPEQLVFMLLVEEFIGILLHYDDDEMTN